MLVLGVSFVVLSVFWFAFRWCLLLFCWRGWWGWFPGVLGFLSLRGGLERFGQRFVLLIYSFLYCAPTFSERALLFR